MPARKHPALIIRTETPLNAGMPLAYLPQAFITPVENFFVRSHAPTPQIDIAAYRLTVGGLVGQDLQLSLADLRDNFPKTTVTATLQCAGNRRDELTAVEPINEQVQWNADPIGNAEWGGVSLHAVMAAAGITGGAQHVAFTGLDEIEEKGLTFGFGGSIPLDKALSGEVLLAYEMNGEALPPDHGAPLRVVVPGYIGARSVKWLGAIAVQAEPSENYYQARAYKIFPPHVRAESADWSEGLMLGELSVTSAICQPLEHEQVAEKVVVQGYAMAGGNRQVERVEVSCDGGESWVVAKLHSKGQRWTWQLWELELDLPPGQQQIISRAWDSAANTQPEDVRKIWNFKGYMNNAWHRVNVTVEV